MNPPTKCIYLFSQGFAEQILEPELEHGSNMPRSQGTYNDAKDSIVADEKVHFDFFLGLAIVQILIVMRFLCIAIAYGI